jgi:CheY-like chemotaxis protein
MRLCDALPPRPLRILVVDDNSSEAPLVRAACQELGIACEIEALTDSRAVLPRLLSKAHPTPDIVLLDVNMPAPDGYSVLGEMKQRPSLRLLPVIMFSGSHDLQAVSRAYDLGANAFIVKPSGSYTSVLRNLHAFWYHCATLPFLAEAARI